jgi:hypothetical protein
MINDHLILGSKSNLTAYQVQLQYMPLNYKKTGRSQTWPRTRAWPSWTAVKLDHRLQPWPTLGPSQIWPQTTTLNYLGTELNLAADYDPDLPWVTVKLDHGLWPWLTLGHSQTWPRTMTLTYPGTQSNLTTGYDSSLSWVAVKLHYGLWL